MNINQSKQNIIDMLFYLIFHSPIPQLFPLGTWSPLPKQQTSCFSFQPKSNQGPRLRQVGHIQLIYNHQFLNRIQFIMGNQNGVQQDSLHSHQNKERGAEKHKEQAPEDYDIEEDELDIKSRLQLSEIFASRFKSKWQPEQPQVKNKQENNSYLTDKYKKGQPVVYKSNFVVGSNPHLETQFTHSTRMRVTQGKNKLPYSAIGYLNFYFDDPHNPKLGTAFLIANKIALTCAHNIYDPSTNAKVAKGLVLILGQRDTYKVVNTIYSNKFNTSNQKYDYAILVLDRDPTPSYGCLGLDFENPLKEEMNVVGVPYEINSNKNEDRDLYEAKGAVFTDDRGMLYYKISTSGGQSGCPIIAEKIIKKQSKFYAIGIHLGKTSNGQFNYARYLDQTLNLQYKAWVLDNKLTLNFFSISPHQIDIISKPSFDNLQKLELRFSLKEIDQSAFNQLVLRLSKMTQLKQLDLGENQIREMDPTGLSESLVDFKVDGNRLKDQFVTKMNKKIWKNLQVLFIGTNNLQEANFDFKNFPNLVRLDLSTNILSSKCLKQLGQQSPQNLQNLNLSDNPMFEKSTQSLDNCSFPKLSILTLNKTNISAKAFQQLKKIKMPFLRTLGLANNSIGESVLRQLGKTKIIEQIVVLNLNDNKFSQLMPILATLNMPNIRSLYLNLSESGPEKLQDKDLKTLYNANFFQSLRNLEIDSSNISISTLKQALDRGKSLKNVSAQYNERISRFDPNGYLNKKVYFDEEANIDTESSQQIQ